MLGVDAKKQQIAANRRDEEAQMKHSPIYVLVAVWLSCAGAMNAQAQQQQQNPQAAPSNEPASSARTGGTAPGEASKPQPSAQGMAPGADKTPSTSAEKPDGDKGAAEKR
jgi:cytoskeletal protein RodZ